MMSSVGRKQVGRKSAAPSDTTADVTNAAVTTADVGRRYAFPTYLLVLAIAALMALPAYAADDKNVAEVSIIKMQFEPQKITVKVGTTVKWINKEKRNNHSIFFEKEGLPESDRLFQDETWQRTFDKPGVYPYICGPHPHMTGEVVVE